MESVGPALVKAGAEITSKLEKEAESFLTAALGEPAKAFGGLIADRVNARRHANLVKITVEAKRNLARAGVSAKEVPLKIIHPMLDAASLEEGPDLQKEWANLLANAADPRGERPVAPIFVEILRHFTSRDARFLNALYAPAAARDTPAPFRFAHQHFQYSDLLRIYSSAGLSRWSCLSTVSVADMANHRDELEADYREAAATIDLLILHTLLTTAPTGNPIKLSDYVQRLPTGRQPTLPSSVEVEVSTRYLLTQLGFDFFKACQPPYSEPS